jgi:hypothetical protein
MVETESESGKMVQTWTETESGNMQSGDGILEIKTRYIILE